MQFANLTIPALLLVAHSHAAVVEHTPQIVFERLCFLRGALGEDVVGVLEVGELGAGFGAGGFAGVEDFGAEFGAGGAKEVRFLLSISMTVLGLWGCGGGRTHIFDVGFRDETFFRNVQIFGKKTSYGLHGRNALVFRKPTFF